MVAAAARDRFLPLPEWGMGWGIELLWWDQLATGARLGIIDDVTIRHLSPLFKDYERSEEERRLRRELDERGLRKISNIQKTVRAWPRWSWRGGADGFAPASSRPQIGPASQP